MTRRADRTISLEERTALAEGVGGDLFVSIHVNAAARSQAHGIETYYLDTTHERHTLRVAARENGVPPQRARSAAARAGRPAHFGGRRELGDAGARGPRRADPRRAAARFGSVANLGVKQGPFYVLFLSSAPSILVEVGFLTHRAEARRLATRWYRQVLAEHLARGPRAVPQPGPAAAGGEGRVSGAPRSTRTGHAGEHPRARAPLGRGGAQLPGRTCAQHLAALQQAGAGGAAVNEAHADAHGPADLRKLYEVAEASWHADGRRSTAGRASPCSPPAATRAARCRSPPTSTCCSCVEDAEAGSLREARAETHPVLAVGRGGRAWARRTAPSTSASSSASATRRRARRCSPRASSRATPRCCTRSGARCASLIPDVGRASSTASATRWRGGASASASRSTCSSRT